MKGNDFNRAPGPARHGWWYYLSVFLPVVLLLTLAVIFSGSSSSSSDCGSGSDCSSSGPDLSGACGEPANLDKSGTVRTFQSLSIKSGSTDLRCGYGVSWKYNWTKAKTAPKRPNVSISVSAPKGGTSRANASDTAGSDGWSGTLNVARGSVGGTSPVPGTITVTASYTPDVSTLFDSVNVSLHLIYYPVKK